MLVREYQDADLDRIKEIHAKSGFDYDLPALSRESFYSRRVIGDNERIGMAAFLRHTSEVYLLCDSGWRNPAWRMEALRQLHVSSFRDAREHGVKEIFGFLPPPVTKRFGRRLTRLGWSSYQGPEWQCYSKGVE